MDLQKILLDMVKMLPDEAKKTLVSAMLNTSLAMNKAEKDVMYQQDAIYDGDKLSQENYRNQLMADLKNGTHSEKVKEMVERYYLILEKAELLSGVLSADGQTVEKTLLKEKVEYGLKDGRKLLESTKSKVLVENELEVAMGLPARRLRTVTTDVEFINSIFDSIIDSVNLKENGYNSNILEIYTKISRGHKDYNNFLNNSGYIQELHKFYDVEVRFPKIRGINVYSLKNLGLSTTVEHNGHVVLVYNVQNLGNQLI